VNLQANIANCHIAYVCALPVNVLHDLKISQVSEYIRSIQLHKSS